MIAVLATALLIGQTGRQSPYQFAIEEPALAGQREMVFGVTPHDLETVGFYHQMSSAVRADIQERGSYDQGTKIREIAGSGFTEEERVGSTSWSVKPTVIGDKVGRMLETEGFRNVRGAVKVTSATSAKLDYRTFQRRTYFVDPKGQIIFEHAVAENPKVGHVEMHAEYGKDSYDLTLTTPQGTTRRTISPGCGMEGLNALFTPMLKGTDVLVKQKEFWVLDPYTGGPQKFTATVSGRFTGKFYEKSWDGRTIDIVGKDFFQRIYVSYEGLLMRVEQSNGYYLHIEQDPDLKPSLKHRKDGGT